MRKYAWLWILMIFVAMPAFLSSQAPEGREARTIVAFVGSASKPALEEAAAVFAQRTGIRTELHFGGSGTMLSQMKMAEKGDLYIPGSPDYMMMAARDGVIDPTTIRIIAYLVPAIIVQRGNPENLRSLGDLARPGLRVGIADPETVCIGLYAMEIFSSNHLLEEVSKNIVTYAESCAKTAALIGLKKVDAVIGWRVFAHWNPETMEAVYLKPGEIPRLAYIPAALSTYAQDVEAAQRFIDFLTSREGQRIFARWGYLATEEEARRYAPQAQIGGEYELPADYEPLVRR